MQSNLTKPEKLRRTWINIGGRSRQVETVAKGGLYGGGPWLWKPSDMTNIARGYMVLTV